MSVSSRQNEPGPVNDVLGIGFGPANLALAIALEERHPEARLRFLEAQPSPEWQPGMLLDGSDIQNHPSRDLVTLRNPRSRFSFLNYLHEEGRLLQHLNLPAEYPLRKEYARYIRWAAGHFGHLVDCDARADRITLAEVDGERVYQVDTTDGRRYLGRSLVVAPGRTPYLPEPFDTAGSRRVFHLTQYLFRLEELTKDQAPRSIAVVGGSQSAVELTLDLARRFPQAEVVNYVRSHSLRQKDTSPFSEEGYFPEFTRYYYEASRASKKTLDAYMHPTNYSSADGDVLRELYMLIHEQRLDGEQRVFVRGNRQARSVREENGRVVMEFEELHTGAIERAEADLVVLATGFRNMGPGPHEELYPPLLDEVVHNFAFEEDGRLHVEADYTLRPRGDAGELPPLFISGLCEATHGIGDAGSFSLLSLRSETLADALAARIDLAGAAAQLPVAVS